jgi:hypothetical protein
MAVEWELVTKLSDLEVNIYQTTDIIFCIGISYFALFIVVSYLSNLTFKLSCP